MMMGERFEWLVDATQQLNPDRDALAIPHRYKSAMSLYQIRRRPSCGTAQQSSHRWAAERPRQA
jgi:hypothetical protein